MSGRRADAAAVAAAVTAICIRDFRLFASHRLRLLTTLFTSAMTVTLFYYISRLISPHRVGARDSYYGYVVVGIIMLGILTSTLAVPVATLRQELVAGTFERLIVSPVGAVRCIASMMVFPLLLTLVTAVFTLLYASVLFGLSPRWDTALAAIPVGMLGALGFAPFGLVMAAAVVRFKQTNAGASFVVTALSLVAGVYFPVVLLPGGVRWVADVQPFTPAVDVVRHLVVGTPLRESAALSLAKLVVFPAVLIPLALMLLAAAIRSSRRQGTIIEF